MVAASSHRPAVNSGSNVRYKCSAVDEFVEHAVSMLHEQEGWLARNRAEIKAKIAEGYAEAQREN